VPVSADTADVAEQPVSPPPAFSAYVVTRGSVPLLWEQRVCLSPSSLSFFLSVAETRGQGVQWNPPPTLLRDPEDSLVRLSLAQLCHRSDISATPSCPSSASTWSGCTSPMAPWSSSSVSDLASEFRVADAWVAVCWPRPQQRQRSAVVCVPRSLSCRRPPSSTVLVPRTTAADITPRYMEFDFHDARRRNTLPELLDRVRARGPPLGYATIISLK
jgi:hypothetical protein